MKSIYQYLNFREYLKDFYEERKKNNPAFSYQLFANRAGFSAKSFLKSVIDGKKNLTESSRKKLNNILKLSEKAFSYFCTLVEFNQADTLEKRNYYFARLSEFNKRNKARVILSNQYAFYSEWYHNTVRELVTLVDFKEDYNRLGKMVQPAISASKARKSVKLLLSLGLIKKKGKRYVQTDKIITTGDNVKNLATQNFHIQNLKIAAKVISKCSPENRDLSCVIMGLSREGYTAAKEEIKQLRKRLLKIAEMDKKQQGVYHVNILLFPTSGRAEKG